MKIKATVRVKLGKLFTSNIVQERVQDVIDEYANLVRNETVLNIVDKQKLFDTGNLANSIQIDRQTLRSGIGNTPNGYYAIYHEFGTKHLKARPFLTPAFEKYKDDFVNELKKVI